MKSLYQILTLIAFALSGCSDPEARAILAIHDWNTQQEILAEALDESEIETRGKGAEALRYAKGSQRPYTGWVKTMRNAEEVQRLAQYKDGRKHGMYAEWLDPERLQSKGRYKDGKKEGLWLEWDEQDNESSSNYVNGEPVNP